ncbi:phage tail protein [Vibrio sp. SCSIO 43169]|uniref:phage tail-collar fiber domain-containing protein n=1 Tax=Vibrio sp. SCSIO 43169 TaxID=2822801 RepID=UPI0020438076|nr:phage tail protein [Vibrio sp. SCSIO 43169]MCM5507136.1 phage tail protein [Vibrio sp. SCSIO 43169]
MSIPESELSYGSILTLTGENAEINGKLNNKPINFTHIAIGDANDVYVQPSRTQTTLVNEITRIPVTGMEKITPSKPDGVPQLKVWAKIPDNIVDIAVREFATVATFDGNSYLHAVGNTVRIPILSGSNNGGEVNDIFIEMTFSVTSLEPIVMIDPTIVTATRDYVDKQNKKHSDDSNPHPQYTTDEDLNEIFTTLNEKINRLDGYSQFLPYDKLRVYEFGEVCYTRHPTSGEHQFWQWYSNVESLSGKSPSLAENRHTGWADNTKPFYWIPYTGNQVGMPLFWLHTEAPEWAVMEMNVNLPVAVYWRLARAYPHLVNNGFINTGEIRGEFLRVLDQGRGVDANRVINSAQLDQMQGHEHFYGDPRMSYCAPGGLNAMGVNAENTHQTDGLVSDGTNGNVRFGSETRSRNVARAMVIVI